MTSKLAGLGRFLGTWYVSTVLLIAVGLAIGSTVFFYAYPGKPKIGVIEIPFTVINDRSTFEISERSTAKDRLTSGKIPSSVYLTHVRKFPTGTWFSDLQATVHAWQPMHCVWSITNPSCKGAAS